jgi:hypothetical protein
MSASPGASTEGSPFIIAPDQTLQSRYARRFYDNPGYTFRRERTTGREIVVQKKKQVLNWLPVGSVTLSN